MSVYVFLQKQSSTTNLGVFCKGPFSSCGFNSQPLSEVRLRLTLFWNKPPLFSYGNKFNLTPFVGTQSGFFLFFAEKRLSVTYLIFRSSKWYSWQLFHPVHGLFVCFSIGRLCPQSDLSSLARIHKWETKSVDGMLNKTGSLCCLHDALSSHKDVPLENIIKHV